MARTYTRVVPTSNYRKHPRSKVTAIYRKDGSFEYKGVQYNKQGQPTAITRPEGIEELQKVANLTTQRSQALETYNKQQQQKKIKEELQQQKILQGKIQQQLQKEKNINTTVANKKDDRTLSSRKNNRNSFGGLSFSEGNKKIIEDVEHSGEWWKKKFEEAKNDPYKPTGPTDLKAIGKISKATVYAGGTVLAGAGKGLFIDTPRGIVQLTTHPIQSAKGIYGSIKDYKGTWKGIQAEYGKNPQGFVGEQLGILKGYNIVDDLARAGIKKSNIFIKTANKEFIPVEEVIAPEVLAGKSQFPMSKGIKKDIELFKSSKESPKTPQQLAKEVKYKNTFNPFDGTSGSFRPIDYSITLNRGDITSFLKSQKEKTLLHEGTHLQQYRSSGISQFSAKTLPFKEVIKDAKSLDLKKGTILEKNVKNYDPKNWNIEAPAWFAETYPTEIINPTTNTGKFLNEIWKEKLERKLVGVSTMDFKPSTNALITAGYKGTRNLEDAGMWITPKGEASSHFLQIQKGEKYGVTLNPFKNWKGSKPNILEIKFKDISEIPPEIITKAKSVYNKNPKEAYKIINDFYQEEAIKGNAYIPFRSVMGETPELQALIPKGNEYQSTVGGIRKFDKYTIYEGELVPIREVEIVNTINKIKNKKYDTNLIQQKEIDDLIQSGYEYATNPKVNYYTPYNNLAYNLNYLRGTEEKKSDYLNYVPENTVPYYNTITTGSVGVGKKGTEIPLTYTNYQPKVNIQTYTIGGKTYEVRIPEGYGLSYIGQPKVYPTTYTNKNTYYQPTVYENPYKTPYDPYKPTPYKPTGYTEEYGDYNSYTEYNPYKPEEPYTVYPVRRMEYAKRPMIYARNNKQKVQAWRPIFYDDEGTKIIGSWFANKKEAENEGFIGTDQSPATMFRVEKGMVEREEIREGRTASRVISKFKKRDGLFIEKQQFRKSTTPERKYESARATKKGKSMDLTPYVYG